MPPTEPQTKRNIRLSLNPWWLVGLLAIAIGVMLFIWKPWSSGTSDRTIEVTGEATIKAEPDAFVFYPNYQFTNTDQAAALAELTKKSDEITKALEGLGVAEKDIKTNSNGYDDVLPAREAGSTDITYMLQLTVTVDNQELAQKVQDYLLTTAPTGSVTPSPTFSDEKQKELEAQARDQATKDARTKADQTGKNLGFKVGKVKSVSDGAGFSIPYRGMETTIAVDSGAGNSLKLYPGENELPYSVTVVYYIR